MLFRSAVLRAMEEVPREEFVDTGFEDTAYADRLRTAGVDVEFVVSEGGPHGFVSLAPLASISQRLFDSAGAFLATKFAAG